MRTSSRLSCLKLVTEHFDKLKTSTSKELRRKALLEFARLASLSMCRTGELNGLSKVVRDLAAYISTEPAKDMREDFLAIVRSEQHEGPPTQLLASLLQCPELADKVRNEMRSVWLKRTGSHAFSCHF